MCAPNPSVSEALALPRLDRKPKHRKALPISEVAHCIECLACHKLRAGIPDLDSQRSGEVRLAQWNEIEMGADTRASEDGAATWVIPAERMKTQRPHRAPLPNLLCGADQAGIGGKDVAPGQTLGDAASDCGLREMAQQAAVAEPPVSHPSGDCAAICREGGSSKRSTEPAPARSNRAGRTSDTRGSVAPPRRDAAPSDYP